MFSSISLVSNGLACMVSFGGAGSVRTLSDIALAKTDPPLQKVEEWQDARITIEPQMFYDRMLATGLYTNLTFNSLSNKFQI